MQSKIDSIKAKMRDRMRSLRENIGNIDLEESKTPSPDSAKNLSILQASPAFVKSDSDFPVPKKQIPEVEVSNVD
jgi:hypothetical protein